MKSLSPLGRPFSYIPFIALLLTAFLLFGCTNTQGLDGSEPKAAPSAGASTELEAEEAPRPGIAWLASALTENGVVVTEYGPIATRLPAETTNRFLLDGRDVVDVYVFRSAELAEIEGRHLAGRFSRRDVYQHDTIVVVRRTRHDSAITGTLHTVLGRMI